jgi:hypothetical protein
MAAKAALAGRECPEETFWGILGTLISNFQKIKILRLTLVWSKL